MAFARLQFDSTQIAFPMLIQQTGLTTINCMQIVNNTGAILYLSKTGRVPTAQNNDGFINSYNTQNVVLWNQPIIKVASNGGAISTGEFLSLQLSDIPFDFPIAPIQPPIPAGLATEATLLTVAARLLSGGKSDAEWLENIRGKLVSSADNGIGAITPDPATFWQAYHDPNTLGVRATCEQAAPGANKYNVVTHVYGIQVALDSAEHGNLIELDDGAGSVKIGWRVECRSITGETGSHGQITPALAAGIRLPANVKARLRFTSGDPNCIQNVAMAGYVYG